MELYIEYVIVDNMVIDYLIVNLIEFSLKEKICKLNKFLLCILGTIMAIILPFLSGVWVSLFKILGALILVFCIKKYKSLKSYITYLFLFVTYTVLIGGVIFGIVNFLGVSYSTDGIIFYSMDIPMGVILIICISLYRLIKLAINKYKNLLTTSTYKYNIRLEDKGNTISGIGYYDSGNNAVFKGKGINIISLDMFMSLYKDIPLQNLLMKNISKDRLRNMEYVEISGIANTNKYLTFTIDSLEINENKYSDVCIAVALRNFEGFDCIISSQLRGKL